MIHRFRVDGRSTDRALRNLKPADRRAEMASPSVDFRGLDAQRVIFVREDHLAAHYFGQALDQVIRFRASDDCFYDGPQHSGPHGRKSDGPDDPR